MEIFGVSFDSVADNKKFAEKYHYPVRLLSDPGRAMGVAFGAADKTDTAYARRIAYVIDHGKITHTYDVKDPANHAQLVLEDVKK